MTSESVGEFSIALVRQGDSDHTLFVTYEVVAGTATAGIDFMATSAGTLEWLAGQLRKTINVPILNDAEAEPAETFTVRLTGVSPDATILSPTEVTVSIAANDPGPHFGQHFYRLWERTGQLTVHVFRGEDGNYPRTVRFRAEDVSARSGADYEATAGELTFAPDQRFLPVTIQLAPDDDEIESIKIFRVVLSDPTDPAATLAVATVQIDDDDTTLVTVEESQTLPVQSGRVRIPVWREHGLSRPASVTYETVALFDSSNPAQPGIDYTPASGRLEFAAGEFERHIEVLVREPVPGEAGSYNLGMRLSNPSTGTQAARTDSAVRLAFRAPENPPAGQPPDRIYGHPDRLSEAMTPDGRYLAVGTQTGTYLWHLPTGRLLQQLATGRTTQAALSPDGSLLATSDGTHVELWEVGTQHLRQQLYVAAQSFSFSPDGLQLAITTAGQRLQLFATDHPAPRRSLPDRELGEGPAWPQLVSPSGRWAFASAGKLVTVWDTRTGTAVLALPGGSEPALAVSPDETRLLIATGGRATLWDLEAHQQLAVFEDVTHGALSAGAARLALSRPGELAVRSTVGAVLWQTNYPAETFEVRAVALSPDGRHLAATLFEKSNASLNPRLLLWNLDTSETTIRLGDFVSHLQFSPDSQTLVVLGSSGTPTLGGSGWTSFVTGYETATQKPRWVRDPEGFSAGNFVFSPDSERIIMPTFQGIQVRQMSDGTIVSGWPVIGGLVPTGAGWSDAVITEVFQDIYRYRNTTAPHPVIAERNAAPGLGRSEQARNGYLGLRNEFWWRESSWGASVVLDAHTFDVIERHGQTGGWVALGGGLFANVEPGGSHISLFQRSTGRRLRSFDLEGVAAHATLSPDDRLLLVNQYYNPSPDIQMGLVRALDTNDGREIWRREVAGLSGHLPMAATTRSGRFVLTPSGSGIIHLQDVQQSEPVASVGGHGALWRLDLLPGGRYALAYMRSALRQAEPGTLLGDAAYHLALWNLEAGQIERVIEGAEHSLSSDGRRLLVRDRAAQTSWSLEDSVTGARLHTWRSTERERYWQMMLSPDGQHVVARGTANDQWMLWLWHADSGELVWRKNYGQTFVGQIAFAPDSRKLLVDLGLSERELLPMTGLTGLPVPGEGSALFSPDGSKLLIRHDFAALYEVQSGAQIVVLDHIPSFRVNNGVFSADSQTLYLSVSQGDWRVPDHLLAVATATGRIKTEFPLVANHPRMAALADEPALLVADFGGTSLLDSQGSPLHRLTYGGLLSGGSMNSAQVALAVGPGQFGIWDLRHVFNLRLEVFTSPAGPQLNWREGTLQWAPDVAGPWSDLPVAHGPWAMPTMHEQAYFRVKNKSVATVPKTQRAP